MLCEFAQPPGMAKACKASPATVREERQKERIGRYSLSLCWFLGWGGGRCTQQKSLVFYIYSGQDTNYYADEFFLKRELASAPDPMHTQFIIYEEKKFCYF